MSEEKEKKRPIKEHLRMIFRTIRILYQISPRMMIISELGAVFRSFTPFVNIYMSALIIDELAGACEVATLTRYVLITITLNLLIAVVNRVVDQISRAEEALLGMRVNLLLANEGLKMDYTDIEDVHTRVLRNRINEAMESGRGGITHCYDKQAYVLEIFCRVIIAAVMSVQVFSILSAQTLTGFLAFMNTPWASVLLAVLILAMSVFSGFSFKKAAKVLFNVWLDWPKRRTLSDYYSKEYIGENGAGKDIRLFHQKDLIKAEMDKWYANPPFITAKFKINCKYDGINLGITSFLTGVVYFFVAMKVVSGAFGIGSLVRYAGLINQFVDAFVLLICEVSKMFLNNDYMDDVFEYLDKPRRMQSGHQTLQTEQARQWRIEFEHVTFRYPGTEVDVLNDVSLTLQPGKSLALVGMNGSGKSTLIKLLCRLYDPTEGRILLNGIDIKEYEYSEYLKAFSVVFQDFRLFAFELGENIAAGTEIDEAKATACLEEAGFAERLQSLEQGLHTYLYKDFDKNGIEPSGGEEQKIALARALYKDAPFMILDEPTAALDPLAEAEIYRKFHEITDQRTAVYISHRLSSCRFCDEIAVLDQGRLVQHGTHQSLVEDKAGKYYELWNAQAQYYV